MQGGMHGLLQYMVQIGASDMHLKAGAPPGFRVSGKLQRAELTVLVAGLELRRQMQCSDRRWR